MNSSENKEVETQERSIFAESDRLEVLSRQFILRHQTLAKGKNLKKKKEEKKTKKF
jgi:hypothetical protein